MKIVPNLTFMYFPTNTDIRCPRNNQINLVKDHADLHVLLLLPIFTYYLIIKNFPTTLTNLKELISPYTTLKKKPDKIYETMGIRQRLVGDHDLRKGKSVSYALCLSRFTDYDCSGHCQALRREAGNR